MLSKLGAIAIVAAIAATGLGSPVFAANDSAAASGGGSAGYNRHVSTDYKLKHHKMKHHQPSQTKY